MVKECLSHFPVKHEDKFDTHHQIKKFFLKQNFFSGTEQQFNKIEEHKRQQPTSQEIFKIALAQ